MRPSAAIRKRAPDGVADLLRLLLSDREAQALRLARRVLLETGSRTAVFADLLHPVQEEVADLWYAGGASYADEVRVAAAVRRLVRRLPPTPQASTVPRGSSCVLAVPHDDPHDIGVTMLALALQDHGWRTKLIAWRGPDEVLDAVTVSRAALFCLSAGILPALTEVERGITAVHRAGVPVLVGGVAFNRRPDLWRRLDADGLGTDVRVGVVLARRLGSR